MAALHMSFTEMIRAWCCPSQFLQRLSISSLFCTERLRLILLANILANMSNFYCWVSHIGCMSCFWFLLLPVLLLMPASTRCSQGRLQLLQDPGKIKWLLKMDEWTSSLFLFVVYYHPCFFQLRTQYFPLIIVNSNGILFVVIGEVMVVNSDFGPYST